MVLPRKGEGEGGTLPRRWRRGKTYCWLNIGADGRQSPLSSLPPCAHHLEAFIISGKEGGREMENKKDFPPPFPHILFPDSRASEVLHPPRLRW